MEFESFLCEKTNHKSLATCERTQILVRNRESPLTAGSTRGEPSNSRESRACTESEWKVARMTWGTIRVTKWHQHPPHDLLALECSSFWHFHQALTRHGHNGPPQVDVLMSRTRGQWLPTLGSVVKCQTVLKSWFHFTFVGLKVQEEGLTWYEM